MPRRSLVLLLCMTAFEPRLYHRRNTSSAKCSIWRLSLKTDWTLPAEEKTVLSMAETNSSEPKPEGISGTTAKRAATKARRRIPGRPLKTPPWTFPKKTLEEAIEIAKAIETQNAGNPMKADILAKAVGFRMANDWRFLDLLRAANQYGLVSGSGSTAVVSMEQIGQDVIAPGSSEQRKMALRKAFRNVEDFRKVEEFYKEKRLPEDEFFENTLVREFNIPRDRVKLFIEVFTRNLGFLRAFRADTPSTEEGRIDATTAVQGTVKLVSQGDSAQGRTFLDTCFVMMPFGPWFDIYYRDIYAPAIREAGMEPIRGDELFSTGSVIEQIWEQIQKSTILLADLTGKNANVFYELGLCHAARKPVVFTSGQLEDVPFDLRHLRVVVYDVKDPFWGSKLKDGLIAFLKNAKNDPDKSIPQPFRDLRKQERNDSIHGENLGRVPGKSVTHSQSESARKIASNRH